MPPEIENCLLRMLKCLSYAGLLLMGTCLWLAAWVLAARP